MRARNHHKGGLEQLSPPKQQRRRGSDKERRGFSFPKAQWKQSRTATALLLTFLTMRLFQARHSLPSMLRSFQKMPQLLLEGMNIQQHNVISSKQRARRTRRGNPLNNLSHLDSSPKMRAYISSTLDTFSFPLDLNPSQGVLE